MFCGITFDYWAVDVHLYIWRIVILLGRETTLVICYAHRKMPNYYLVKGKANCSLEVKVYCTEPTLNIQYVSHISC